MHGQYGDNGSYRRTEPTAYDVDKVIKELENIREFNNSENINVSSIIMYRK